MIIYLNSDKFELKKLVSESVVRKKLTQIGTLRAKMISGSKKKVDKTSTKQILRL